MSRDEQILQHIARYRVSTRPALSELFFGGGNPGNVVQRLLRSGRIASRKGLPDNARFYQLTPKEVDRRGLPLNRAKPFGPQALATHLMLLWYCVFPSDGSRRLRMEQTDLHRLFTLGVPTGDHCVEWSETDRILNVVCPRLATPPRKVIARVSDRCTKAAGNAVVRSLAAKGKYALVIVTRSEAHAERYREALHRHERRQLIPIRVAVCRGAPALACA